MRSSEAQLYHLPAFFRYSHTFLPEDVTIVRRVSADTKNQRQEEEKTPEKWQRHVYFFCLRVCPVKSYTE